MTTPTRDAKSKPTKQSRAARLAQELEQRQPELIAKGIIPDSLEVKQSETVGMENLEKRRTALKKLRTFMDGVL